MNPQNNSDCELGALRPVLRKKSKKEQRNSSETPGYFF